MFDQPGKLLRGAGDKHASSYLFCVSQKAALICAALLAACPVVDARGELTWEQKTADLASDGHSDVLEAHFRFTNTGTAPVDIGRIQTSCGCTTAALAQRHYEHGEAGEIVARFAAGERTGLQKKTILVATSDNPLIPTLLTLVVHLPEYVRLEPAAISWKPGDAPLAKMIQVISVPGAAVPQAVTVFSSNRLLPATLQPAGEPGAYVIAVTPAATDKPEFATLSIHCKLGTGVEKTFHAFASVQAPMPVRRVPAAPPAASAASPIPVDSDE